MLKLQEKIIIGIDLTPHKIDAVTAALTTHLHLQGKTEKIGNQDSYIVVPIKTDWRKLQL